MTAYVSFRFSFVDCLFSTVNFLSVPSTTKFRKVLGAGAGGGGPAAVWGAGLDAEDQTGHLFSLLYDHGLPGGGGPEPPGLDVDICQGLEAVMAMPHNSALALRVQSESRARARAVSGEAGVGNYQTLAANRVQVDRPCLFALASLLSER